MVFSASGLTLPQCLQNATGSGQQGEPACLPGDFNGPGTSLRSGQAPGACANLAGNQISIFSPSTWEAARRPGASGRRLATTSLISRSEGPRSRCTTGVLRCRLTPRLTALFTLVFTFTVALGGISPAQADDPTGANLEDIISAADTPAPKRVDALLTLAERHRDAGFKRKALPLLDYAMSLRNKLDHPGQARLHIAHGALLHDLGRYPEAIATLETALASGNLKGVVRARLLNELGVVYGSLGDVGAAVARLREAEQLAQGDALLFAQVTTNRARALISAGQVRSLEQALRVVEAALDVVPSGLSKSELLISAAALYRQAYWFFDFPQTWLVLAAERLSQAAELATGTGNVRLVSYARGHLGRLYEDDQAFGTALALTRQAAFHANAVGSYESAYLWEWQIGRILHKQGETSDAIAAYEQAIETLERVRQDLIDGSPYTFHEKVQPLFTELSDILLIQARRLGGEPRQVALHDIQDILEQAKSAELQDYFQNECVLPENSVELDQIEKGTATVYPIILDNRVEILVSIGGHIHQFTSDVARAELIAIINDFRDNLQVDQGDDEYLEIASELYELLVAPFADLLADNGVKTLLFVPDGALRTIPISALHDGDEYLIEQFSIATTPGLNLTLPKPLELQQATVFAGGISEAVQGFSSLPGVPGELDNLQAKYGASVLQDGNFRLEDVTDQMSNDDYSIVHIATHGHFDSNPEKSFLLAYDDKLTMNLLERSIGIRKVLGEPLELLVLSACETAAGDNRAALGLAGVALKAGARSAVATLWQISDAATVELIDEFYSQAAGGEHTKAESLRQAQLRLIRSDRFMHPSDWAPFLLIGNWL